jgi:CheY-like chemotaxis protein
VWGDAPRLRQVFWNLLINAIKSSEGGRVEIETSNGEAGELRVRVADNGVGMDDETLRTLFLPFEQRPTSSSGLGLGLSICKGIVDAHGGQIWASSPGRGFGSAFEVHLPTTTAASVEEPAVLETSPPPPPAEARRVLLVEDDPDSAETLALILSAEGHEVGLATSVQEALQKAGHGWDVVVSDLALPDGSGLDVARALKERSPAIRLVAMSGYGAPEDVRASWNAGFHFHLVKPVDLAKLRRLLSPPADR